MIWVIVGLLILVAAEGVFILSDRLPWKKVKKK